jgi:hypothetical protein
VLRETGDPTGAQPPLEDMREREGSRGNDGDAQRKIRQPRCQPWLHRRPPLVKAAGAPAVARDGAVRGEQQRQDPLRAPTALRAGGSGLLTSASSIRPRRTASSCLWICRRLRACTAANFRLPPTRASPHARPATVLRACLCAWWGG